MRIEDLIVVGIPEVIFILFTILALYNIDILKEMRYKRKENIRKILISLILVLMVNVISRRYFHNFIEVSITTTVIYTLILGYIWKLNSNFIFGLLASFVITSSEVLTYPIMNMLIDSKMVNPLIESQRFLLTIPSKTMQLIILIIALKLNLKLYCNPLFDRKFIKLSLHKKINALLLMLANIVALIFTVNYVEMFAKIRFQDIKDIIINENTKIFYISSIVFIMIVFVIFKRMIANEVNKQIIKSPKKSFEKIIQFSKREEIEYYARLLVGYLNIIDIEDIENIFDKLSTANCDINYNIDEKISLTVFEHRYLLELFEYLIEILSNEIEVTSLFFDMKENKNSIYISIIIKLNDLQKIKFKRYIAKDKYFSELRKNLIFKNNASFDINFTESIVNLVIKVPVKEVIFHENKS